MSGTNYQASHIEDIKEQAPYAPHNMRKTRALQQDWECLRRRVRTKIRRRRRRARYNVPAKIATKFTIISWLIDVGVVQENVEVFCVDKTTGKVKKRGNIERHGVSCTCCNGVFTVAEFNQHAGQDLFAAYRGIFVSPSNVSLLSCMIEGWNKVEEVERGKGDLVEMMMMEEASDIYDDACMICADGGSLVCCDGCSSTYHQLCMDMEEVPKDFWHCPYCVCKFCAKPDQEKSRLIRCPQCEKKYHWQCHEEWREEGRSIDLNSIPTAPFCERSCRKVHEKLEQVLVGRRNELDAGYSWSLLRRMDECTGTGVYMDDEYLRTMSHSKLAVARRLMEECFDPIQDRYTKLEVIPSLVYSCWSNFGRINFHGFYTAVLEKDEEIISVASIRIHGTKLAEMPLIATSAAHRRKGMCRKLMGAIESTLCYLNVENLLIPSVIERVPIWTEKYGFHRIDQSMRKQIMLHNTVMFFDTIRLQKKLLSSSYSMAVAMRMQHFERTTPQ